ncbi:MAG: acetylxylan esterase [Armatimonadota bacterium]|nr:acetylxylan esterase [Armatimonadota bacterium]MCX7777615.1 acetylxylan esterase [Armatimonadota bacterium]MDW8024707.1 acetylxylan esterase [Armatimonadota bacterium]
MTIREYLSHEAIKITENALKDFTSKEAFHKLLPMKRMQFLEMMGLSDLPPHHERPPVKAVTTGVLDKGLYRIHKLYYESIPNLFVTANLYMPKRDGRAPFPAVLYFCGHSQNQKWHYQAHPRHFAQLGFVCLIVETIQLGEVQGYHHGCYREGWFHWYSRGYTPAGVELLNAIRAIDFLTQLDEVDRDKIGATGISGGGATTWWVAAADERVKVAAPVCATATLASHIYDKTIDGHCDCMWWINTYLWDLADVGALIAPRALMIASSDRDAIFTIQSIRKVYSQLKRLYEMLGVADNLRLVETPGAHSYHRISRTSIFSWFMKHLQGREIPPEQVEDIDESNERIEPIEALRVYVDGEPKGNRVRTIQDDFIKLAEPPKIDSEADLRRVREKVVSELKRKTFNAFPKEPPPLDLKVEFEFAHDGATGCRFAFTSEEGWRLHGTLVISRGAKQPAPAIIAPRNPLEGRNETESFLGRINVPYAKVVVELRGTGDTAWGEELQWHIRRAAAWTGRTIASMRVYDLLRALEAARSLPQVDANSIAIAARGEMAAVALYAALLDGRVRTLILQSPPATQNAPSSRDGRGQAIEMLNCLQITDLPQVAGLLYPTEIVFVGDMPNSYLWAKELYGKLGSPHKFIFVHEVSGWKPSL